LIIIPNNYSDYKIKSSLLLSTFILLFYNPYFFLKKTKIFKIKNIL